jgi:hypothetical protein
VITVDNLPEGIIDGALSCRFTTSNAAGQADFSTDAVATEAVAVPAAAGADGTVVCFSPPQQPGLASLEVVLAGDIEITCGAASKFSVYATPTVDRIRPAAVHEGGGATITVHGSNFGNTDSIFCRFGTVGAPGVRETVRATWLAESLCECVVPSHKPGQAFVEVTLNGLDYTGSGVSLTYITEAIVVGAAPLRGPASGGTLVHVVGSGFLPTANSGLPVCVFGGVSHVLAEPGANDTHVSCRAPSSPVDLARLAANGARAASHGAGSDDSNMASTYSVSFTVLNADLLRYASTTNGGNSSDHITSIDGLVASVSSESHAGLRATLSFTYIAETTVRAVVPSFGHRDGSALVSIMGASVPTDDGSSVSCVFEVPAANATGGFERHTVPAVNVVSANEVVCSTPTVGISAVAIVRLSITAAIGREAEATLTPSSTQYTFHGDVQIRDAAPALGPETGGTSVTISLDREQGLASFIPLACVFGGVSDGGVARAIYVGTSNVRCDAPPHAPGPVSVTLFTWTGEDSVVGSLGSNELAFMYHETLTVGSFSPREAVGNGGTVIDVLGTNFINVSSMVCRFGVDGTVVPAIFVDSSLVRCVCPVLTHTTAVSSGGVRIFVSANGVQWASAGEDLLVRGPSSAVVSLRPARGPATGGTLLQITGSGFFDDANDDALFACRFAMTDSAGNPSVVVPANRFSDTLLQCPTPNAASALAASQDTDFLSVGVEVTLNGIDFTSSGMAFSFYATPVVASISPVRGGERGGTVVTITGSNFPRNRGYGTVLCRFGEDENTVTADWVSPTALRCTAPAHLPSVVELALTFNGVDYTSAYSFEYSTAARITGRVPASGPVEGGTLLTLSGVNFPKHNHMYCRMGASLTPAAWISATQLTCRTPPQVSTGSVALDVVSDDGDRVWSDVQNGGSLAFTYVPRLTVSHVTPTWGTTSGGTVIQVRGTGVANVSTLSCSFFPFGGNAAAPMAVPAVYVSSFRAACVTPAVAAAGRHAVEISNNGFDFSANGLQFEYVEPASVDQIAPAVGTLSGGTVVQVMGKGFVDSPALACTFGEASAMVRRAVFKSANQISCVSPPASLGITSVAVTTNGIDYSAGVPFRYLAAPTATAVSPSDISSQRTSSSIVVIGTSFHNASGSMYCYFQPEQQDFPQDSVATRATFLNETAVACEAPVLAIRDTTVSYESTISVTHNGQEFSNSLAITVSRVPEITMLTPLTAFAGASTRLNISGSHFRQSRSLACGLVLPGGEDALMQTVESFPVHYISPGMVACDIVVPRASGATTVTIVVTNNGIDYSGGGPGLLVADPPRVSSLAPALGPISGATTVVVRGEGFPARGMMCRFGSGSDSIVPARRVSVREATCASPVFSGPGHVQFDVLVDGHVLVPTETQLTFFAHHEVTVTGALPNFAVVSGGTDVMISGTGFRNSSLLSCAFGGKVVPATYIGPHGVSCVAPPQATSGSGHTLGVALNGVDFTRTEFEYLAVPRVFAVQPRTSPPRGGVELLLTGVHFAAAGDNAREHLVCCANGIAASNATLVSEEQVRCDAPSAEDVELSGSAVALSVSVDGGRDCSGDSVQLVYRTDPVVSSVSPAWGTEEGGTIITVSGSGFGFGFEPLGNAGGAGGAVTTQLTCHFGEELRGDTLLSAGSPATVLSDTTLQCASPAHAVGRVTLFVSTVDSIVVSGAGVAFHYRPHIFVTTFSPLRGPSCGGTRLDMSGINFATAEDLMCQFGTKVVDAVVVSPSRLSCTSPPVQLAAQALTVPVTLLTNGGQDAVSVGDFAYTPGVRVSTLVPARGPRGGGTRVRVQGVNFEDTGSLMCQFGDSATSYAHFVDSTQLECEVPSGFVGSDVAATAAGSVAFTLVDAYGTQGLFSVGVVGSSGNTADSSQEQLRFAFYEHPTLSYVTPSSVHEHSTVVVRISGAGFLDTGGLDMLRCAAGADQEGVSSSNRAVWLSPTLLECQVSVAEPSEGVAVRVSMNGGLDFTPTGVRLKVLPSLRVSGLSPTVNYIGVATDASVRVIGAGFDNTSTLACYFGAGRPARWTSFVSRTAIDCGVPRVPGPTVAHVTVTVDGTEFSSPVVPSAASGGMSEMTTAFHFMSPPSVSHITPASSLLSGGATITVVAGVSGDRDEVVVGSSATFVDVPGLTCRFGPSQGVVATTVPAVFVNASAIQCVTPPSAMPRLSDVRVSLDGGASWDALGDAPQLRFLRAPLVSSVRPRIVFPGALVTVVGDNFEDNPHLSVRVGSVAIPPAALARVSASTFRFAAPVHPTGPALLSVAHDRFGNFGGVSGASSNAVLEYRNVVELTRLSPDSGVSITGDMVIAVTGTNFASYDGTVLCRFTAVEKHTRDARLGVSLPSKFASQPVTSPGTHVSDTLVKCTAPARWSGGRAVLEISCNGGHDFTSSGLSFGYQGRTSMSEIMPAAGPASGGTLVVISGTTLPRSEPSSSPARLERMASPQPQLSRPARSSARRLRLGTIWQSLPSFATVA